jgi:formate hydrogenlyase transcriptional activator
MPSNSATDQLIARPDHAWPDLMAAAVRFSRVARLDELRELASNTFPGRLGCSYLHLLLYAPEADRLDTILFLPLTSRANAMQETFRPATTTIDGPHETPAPPSSYDPTETGLDLLLSGRGIVLQRLDAGSLSRYIDSLQPVLNDDVHCVATLPLRDGDRVIGLANFFFAKGLSAEQQSGLELAGALLATALAQLAGRGTRHKQERELELLLKLAESLGAVRTKNELLLLINTTLKKLFHFTHCSIPLLGDSRRTFTIFLSNEDFNARKDPRYREYVLQPHNVYDGIIDMILHAGAPLVFDLKAHVEKGDSPPYVYLNYDNGSRFFIGMPLGPPTDRIGLLAFFTNTILPPEPATLQLIRVLSHPVTLAISNIRSQEALHERENEQAVLLNISRDLSMVTRKEELPALINKWFKGLVPYDHSVIGLATGSGATYRAYVLDPQSVVVRRPDLAYLSDLEYAADQGVLQTMTEASGPLVIDLQEEMAKNRLPEFMQANFSLGMREAVLTTLRVESGRVGCLILFSQHQHGFTVKSMALISGISSQLAMVVASLKAKEELMRRDEEKSILLSFTIDIAMASNKRALAGVLEHYLKQQFRITNFVLALQEGSSNSYRYFLTELGALPRSSLESLFPGQPAFELPGSLASFLLASDQPRTFDLAQLLRKGQIAYPDASFWEATRLSQVTGVPLRVADRVIGWIWTEAGEVEANLLVGIASQIAIAVAHFTNLDHLQQREAEKSLLLSFSQDIASVSDMNGLALAIKKHLHALLPGMEYMVSLIDAETRTHQLALYDESATLVQKKEFQVLLSLRMPLAGNIGGVVLAANEPVVFGIDELIENGGISVTAGLWKANGVERLLGIALRTGSADVGILWTDADKADLRLLVSASSQIATALANILANQKIKQQLTEIDSYKQRLEEENLYLHTEIVRSANNFEIIGSGPEMEKVYALLSQVAFANSTVLLMGETGTGKELVARAVHNHSPRKDRLMVKVNCAALPAALIESELFGHERGSFTGAHERRIGKFELAHNGTLFLDEIGEMPLELQVKLLRAIQEKEIERVGAKTTIKVDVRIVAATNRDLLSEVKAGRFRSDLYYRLNVFPIQLPALRDRKVDIPQLASHFVERFARNAGKNVQGFSPAVLSQLMAYHWPGNVRELEHVIERSVLLATGTVIRVVDLPTPELAPEPVPAAPVYQKTLEEHERDYILEVLTGCQGKIYGQRGAAQLLGVPASTLNSKLKKLGIAKNEVEFYSKRER